MQRKLVGIVGVDFDVAGQQLVINSAVVKYLREREKKGEYKEAAYQLFTNISTSYNSVRKAVLHNILNEFGISITLVKPIKICLSETYSRVRADKHLCDMFTIQYGLKQGYALSQLFLNFAFECVIRRFR
jgi:hypothetical protein